MTDWFDDDKDKKKSARERDKKNRRFSFPAFENNRPFQRIPESIPGPKLVGSCQPFNAYRDSGNYVQVELKDEKGNPVPNEPFTLKLPNGKKEEGKLDGKYGWVGYPISKNPYCWITFPKIAPSYWKPKSSDASSEMESVEGSKEHIVEQGDSISSIASELCMSSEYICDHPKNKDLRTLRKNPSSLLPGDRVYIPEKLIRWEKCSINNLNSFVVRKPDVAELIVQVKYLPDRRPIPDATITLISTSGSKIVKYADNEGKVFFDGLNSNEEYQITTAYEPPNPIVKAARSHVHEKLWAKGVTKPPYGGMGAKCNIFVYDVLTEGGTPPPLFRRKKVLKSFFSVSGDKYENIPYLAAHWAKGEVPGWELINNEDAAPGDVIAELHANAHLLSDGGHVGIYSYPESLTKKVFLSAECRQVDFELQRRTVSAADSEIKENDWGFRPNNHPVFLRKVSGP